MYKKWYFKLIHHCTLQYYIAKDVLTVIENIWSITIKFITIFVDIFILTRWILHPETCVDSVQFQILLFNEIKKCVNDFSHWI